VLCLGLSAAAQLAFGAAVALRLVRIPA
jgi:hypothetical protein